MKFIYLYINMILIYSQRIKGELTTIIRKGIRIAERFDENLKILPE